MPRYLIREQDVQGYSPANHHGTVNRRLVMRIHDQVLGIQPREIPVMCIARTVD